MELKIITEAFPEANIHAIEPSTSMRVGLMTRILAGALVPVGAVLVDLMPLDAPQPIPEAQVAGVPIGQHRYDIWLSGHPVHGDSELIRWHMRYDQLDGDTPIRSFETDHDWRTFSLDKVVDEAGKAGFKAERLADSPVPAALLRLMSRQG